MEFFQRLMQLAQKLVELMNRLLPKLEHLSQPKPQDEYVNSKWVQKTFGISSSTLSDYRRRGIIPYTYFEEGGKILYKVSDLYEILDRNYQGKNGM